jgi:hypothetical protein
MTITITETTTIKTIRRIKVDNMKAVHADDLLYIAYESSRNKFNRTVDTGWLKTNLDPNGISLITIMLAFHNMDFAGIQHHRCKVLAKLNYKTEPVEFYLDIAHDSYQKLFPVERFLPVENGKEPVAVLHE